MSAVSVKRLNLLADTEKLTHNSNLKAIARMFIFSVFVILKDRF